MLPEEVVQKQLEYYNNHDINSFVSTYSKNIRFFNIGETNPFIVGIEALYKRYSERFLIPNLNAKIANRMTLGSFVIDHEHISGLKEEITEVIVIYEVKNDLIENVWSIRE